jgi:hypothetical protein
MFGAAGGAAALGALGPMSASAGGRRDRDDEGGRRGSGRGDIPLDRIGIQLFTVRDLLADNELDLPGRFEMLADAGYAEVEIGGTYDGRIAAEFRALANQYGLKPEGSHVPGAGATWRGNRAQVFADAAALGLRYVGIAIPTDGTPRTHEGYKAMAEEFNVWGAEARQHGLRFYFHNHPDDFTLDGGTPIYDTLLEETDRRPGLVRARHRLDRGGRPECLRLRSRGPRALPAVPRQGHQVGPGRSAHHARNRRAAEPALPASRRGQGGHRLRQDLLGPARPRRPPLLRRARRRAR